MQPMIFKTGLALALTGLLAACNPNSPQAQQDAREAKTAARQAGNDLGQAATSTATAAGEAVQAAATSTAEAAGKAAVVADRATDDMAADLDRATAPIQQAYQDGKAQEQSIPPQPVVLPPRDPLNNAVPPPPPVPPAQDRTTQPAGSQ